MITSIFKKSTPINYSFLGIVMVLFFFIYQFQDVAWTNSVFEIGKKIGLLVILFASLFLSNFIVKKNGLTKDSSYTLLYFFLFFLLFPNILNNYNLVIANFFILLAIRRLFSLQTLKAPKEKIFDAVLWIILASFFQFWCILFLILVYVSIIFHVSRDYRNWLVPFVALLTVLILFILYALLIDKSIINSYLQSDTVRFQIDYFSNTAQNIAFSIYVVFILFFLFSFLLSIANKSLNLKASFRKVIFSLFLGIVIFIITTNKSNEVLVFTFLPMAIMATNSIEYFQNKIQQEIILAISIICGFICFFIQL
jgi:hypothetical protein